MRPIDFYFDFISPYGYLASTRIEALAARHGRTVTWRPFLMGVPIIKVMGLKPLMETPLKRDYTRKDVFRLALWLDVPLAAPNPGATHSRSAARAFYWLADRSPAAAEAFARAVFHAMWVRSQDITDVAVLQDICEGLGVPGARLAEALETPAVKDRLGREVDAAVARGVFGSPFVIADGEPFWGVDRLPMLESWLATAAWPAARDNQEIGE